jgi:hypothetical protein
VDSAISLSQSLSSQTEIFIHWPGAELSHALSEANLWSQWLRHQILQAVQHVPWRENIASQISSRFLQRQRQLDRLVASVLQLNNAELAQEFYFRILEREADFPDLCGHSLGPERYTFGRIGPIEAGALGPLMAAALRHANQGELQPPTETADGRYLLIRLEQRLPAQLDQSMRNRLTEELFDQWLADTTQALLANPPAPSKPFAISLKGLFHPSQAIASGLDHVG